MLISVRRFGIDTIEAMENREREWERHRRKNKLDLLGGTSEKRPPDACHSMGHDIN
jgi:hypothetical protein